MEPERGGIDTRPKPLGLDACPAGPLKTLRLRRAKIGMPGDAGIGPVNGDLESGVRDKLAGVAFLNLSPFGMLGVPGSIRTELCGERAILFDATDSPPGLATELEDVDDALDNVWMWPGWKVLRISTSFHPFRTYYILLGSLLLRLSNAS